MAATRSFHIKLNNNVGREWTRTEMALDHGIWENNDSLVPPETIAKPSLDGDSNVIPGVAEFGSESDGFATGTEGHVAYQDQFGGRLYIGWDNPFVGSNGFGVEVPDGIQMSPPVDQINIDGSNPSVEFTLGKA